MKKDDKKMLIKLIIYISIIIILIVILVFLIQVIYDKISNKKSYEKSVIGFIEKNKEKVFSINKIIFFSSCDSKRKTISPTNFTMENLYTYTDMALFINNNSEENSLENTLKNVKISNIKITKKPLIGEPNIYYKSINNFAKSEFEENNKIEEELKYEITSEDQTNFDNPVLYNNCANPITLSYINQNIKTDYTITDTKNPIIYNGTLLSRCGVSIDLIETSISFDIYLENNKNQKFKSTVYFNIPYENNEKSIYGGNLSIKKETDFNFYRYE